MLVLSRKQGENIRIGDDIVMTVLSVSDTQVKIGIEAPPDVKIFREEVLKNIRENLLEASRSSTEKILTDVSKLSVNKLGIKADECENKNSGS